ncbi:MAG: 50S ribosomal protein L21e [Methanopyri archaeon]|jgi:large subunit ribosomal protein L21e|nr:50S ribosomal protein L21e [Methanopyri archaeon]
MVERSHGFRVRTRNVLQKKPREKGKVTVNQLLRTFEVGDRAAVTIEPSVHKGMPHPKFQGRTGTIVEKRGDSYVLRLKDGNKIKDIIGRAVHFRPLGE